jgi:serine/threonine protein kinase
VTTPSTSPPDSDSTSASDIDTTPLLDGRFVPFRRLGAGSQAETLEAVDRANGCAVAIKRFDVHGASSWKDVELAEREAKVLEQLHHPALPKYVVHFEHKGALYLVMERIQGEDLACLVKKGYRFSTEELLRLIEMLADVFQYLHGQSPPIVHRDIKPSNILRCEDGRFMVIDFGSVRDGLRPQGGSTVVGTFGFMAPEQFQGRALPASDLYGAGATLLTLMTGVTPDRLPHRGLEIDVRASVPHAPAAWLQLLEHLLRPDPDERSVALSTLLPALRAHEAAGDRRSQFHDPQGGNSGRTDYGPSSGPSPRANGNPDRDFADYAPLGASPRANGQWMVGSGMAPMLVLFLSLARVAIYLLLQVVLPLVLTVLAGIFGRNLRQAALNVTRAGQAANFQLLGIISQISHSQPRFMGPQRGMHASPFRPTNTPWFGVGPRPTSQVPKKRMRVGDFDVELPPEDDERERRARRR